MSRQRRLATGPGPAQRRKRFKVPWWALLGGGALVLLTPFLVSLALRTNALSGGGATPGTTELPGPLGGPEIAQDVNTLVGRPAPSFSLSDSEGKSYTVMPGTGKPLVLVFHMGIT